MDTFISVMVLLSPTIVAAAVLFVMRANTVPAPLVAPIDRMVEPVVQSRPYLASDNA